MQMIDYNTRRSHKCSKYGAPRCALLHLLFCLTGRSTLCSQMTSCPIARFFQTQPLSFHDNWLLQNLTYLFQGKKANLFCVFVCSACVFSQCFPGWTNFLTCTALNTKRGDMTGLNVVAHVSATLGTVAAFCALETKTFSIHLHLGLDQIIELLKSP